MLERVRGNAAICAILFTFVLCLNLYMFQHAAPRPLEVTTETIIIQTPSTISERDQLYQQMILWPYIIKASHAEDWMLTNDLQSTDVGYLSDCWNDPDWFRMYADPYCSLLWLQVLEHEIVFDMEQVLGVVTYEEKKAGAEGKKQQNGGARCHFMGLVDSIGITGYWKPCLGTDLPTNSESFAAEIIAFHIDRILGFYHTPAVAPRTFSKKQFNALAKVIENHPKHADKNIQNKFDSVLNHCGRFNGEYADGATVGWSPKNIQLLSKHLDVALQNSFFVKFHDLTDEDLSRLARTQFNIQPYSKPEDIHWVLENVAVNIFAILTNNFSRFGHNLFIQTRTNAHTGAQEFGPFIYLDNDRSSWKFNITRKGKIPNDPLEHPLAKFCKFPKQIAQRILILQELSELDSNISFGKLVYWAVSVYQDVPSGPLFSLFEASNLDIAMSYVARTIQHCLDHHPQEEVLFLEPWATKYDFMENIISIFANLPRKLPEEEFLSNFTSIPQ